MHTHTHTDTHRYTTMPKQQVASTNSHRSHSMLLGLGYGCITQGPTRYAALPFPLGFFLSLTPCCSRVAAAAPEETGGVITGQRGSIWLQMQVD